MSFASEREMTQLLAPVVARAARNHGITVAWEVERLAGRPDLVFAKENSGSVSYVVAVELKLRSWRRALTQAIRYRTFANEAYVLMATKSARTALKHPRLFENSGVGLATLRTDGTVDVHFISQPRLPFCLPVAGRLATTLCGGEASHPFMTSIDGRHELAKFAGQLLRAA